MTKRVCFSFIVLLIGVASLTAATTSTDRDTKAELPVYWDLSDISSAYKYSFGFYDAASGGNAISSSGLELTTDNSTAGKVIGKGTVYILWDIAAPMTVNLSLLSAPMTGNTSTSINWQASWRADNGTDTDVVDGNVTISAGSIGGTGTTAIYTDRNIITHNGTSSAESSGFCKLEIETANAFSAEPGEYSATLTLKVASN